jgi:hypothetical protein
VKTTFIGRENGQVRLPLEVPIMSKLTEKIFVECALNQAPGYLQRFFATQGSLAGDIVVPLRLTLGIAALQTDLEKNVVFTVSNIAAGADMVPRLTLHWEPEGGGPFPTFDGTLTIEAGDDYSDCAIALRGTYEPPFGVAGKTFDATAGRRIASATAREFLERIRDYVEDAYRETEREKSVVREAAR